MPNKKPEPLFPGRQQQICSVCGKVSYSRSGTHPQCSVKQADDERILKQKKQAEQVKDPPDKSVSRWQKLCPKCKTRLHVRKKVCDCGHTFDIS